MVASISPFTLITSKRPPFLQAHEWRSASCSALALVLTPHASHPNHRRAAWFLHLDHRSIEIATDSRGTRHPRPFHAALEAVLVLLRLIVVATAIVITVLRALPVPFSAIPLRTATFPVAVAAVAARRFWGGMTTRSATIFE